VPANESLRSHTLLPGIIAGVLVGSIVAISSLSFGILIFSGPLVPYLRYGVGIGLVTAMITTAGLALTSGIPAVIGCGPGQPSGGVLDLVYQG
jgi:hypothetical protein